MSLTKKLSLSLFSIFILFFITQLHSQEKFISGKAEIIDGDSIKIIGLEEIDRLFVLRELTFKAGDLYNAELIQVSERQLFETSLFSLVDIIPSKSNLGNDWINVNVEIKELGKRDLIIEPGFAHIPSSSAGGEPISGIEGAIRLVDRSIYNTGVRLGLRSSIDLPIDALVNRGTVPEIFR